MTKLLSWFLTVYVIYLIPMVSVSIPAWYFSRHRVQWTKWEIMAFFLPVTVWFVLIYFKDFHRSLSNAAVEPFCLGVVISLFALVRIILGNRLNQKRIFSYTTFLFFAVPVSFWLLFPGLPE